MINSKYQHLSLSLSVSLNLNLSLSLSLQMFADASPDVCKLGEVCTPATGVCFCFGKTLFLGFICDLYIYIYV